MPAQKLSSRRSGPGLHYHHAVVGFGRVCTRSTASVATESAESKPKVTSVGEVVVYGLRYADHRKPIWCSLKAMLSVPSPPMATGPSRPAFMPHRQAEVFGSQASQAAVWSKQGVGILRCRYRAAPRECRRRRGRQRTYSHHALEAVLEADDFPAFRPALVTPRTTASPTIAPPVNTPIFIKMFS